LNQIRLILLGRTLQRAKTTIHHLIYNEFTQPIVGLLKLQHAQEDLELLLRCRLYSRCSAFLTSSYFRLLLRLLVGSKAGDSNLFLKDQIIDILGLWPMQSLLQILNSATAAQKQL
jgi:hypothetical protein